MAAWQSLIIGEKRARCAAASVHQRHEIGVAWRIGEARRARHQNGGDARRHAVAWRWHLAWRNIMGNNEKLITRNRNESEIESVSALNINSEIMANMKRHGIENNEKRQRHGDSWRKRQHQWRKAIMAKTKKRK